MSLPGQSKEEVMLCNTTDFSFRTLQVEKNTEEVLYCKKRDGVHWRFFKEGPGWKEKITRHLAAEGYPLITWLAEGVKVTKPLEDFLRTIWGDEAYNKLPELLRNKIVDPKVGCTVTIKPKLPDEESVMAKMGELKADAMLYDSDLANLNTFGMSKEVKKWQETLMDSFWRVLAGIAICYFLQGVKILPILK